ncbi:hypothetical protein G7092_20275 [Mucilaginibacter sp. HC2]|uniref:hypothetical protein n=1 Tax=Mucilaginibacter inviolabilis TaxID=2714892 RepID=UPI00140E4E62|nr:hypothetical protein [Mucilaginibacter inviolabilis]NHA06157.1 hypothetical protein [Mucilaginibacter inviolabilis]
MTINTETLLKFSKDNNIQKLTGGQAESFLIGQHVIKPVHDVKEYLWIAQALENLDLTEINLAKPACSLHGNYIEDGFGATSYFENKGHLYDVETSIRLCRKLNQILQKVTKPAALFSDLNNPWKKANFLAWHGKANKTFPNELRFLMSLRVDIDLDEQLIHMDLAGNILINELNETCVIDFTPGFYPKEYAEAIVLVDSVSLYQAPISVLNEINLDKKIAFQLILRALIFRMSVCLFCEPSSDKKQRFYGDLNSFKKVYDYFN